MRKLKITKRFLTSIIALILLVVMAAGVTYSWVEGGPTGYLSGNEIFISTGSNLTMRQDGKITDCIIIPSCELFETSSADGRNFFFPLGNNTKSTNDAMKFREGTSFDVNKKYISIDFQLEADKSVTPVYLGSGTMIKCDNKDVLDALRMSISTNDGTTPVVFKPNQMPGSALMEYAPIVAIDNKGDATTANPVIKTQSYGNYYYQGDSADSVSKPIFTIPGDETLNITVSIWLEGTEVKNSSIAGKGLEIYLDFTTKASGLIKYTFIDNCRNRNDAMYNFWVDDKMSITGKEYDTMVYLYDNTEKRYYAMRKTKNATDTSGAQWQAYIPDTINNFYFRRYSIDIDTWWNEWEPTMTGIPTITNSQTNERERTFVAIAGQKESDGVELDGCYGYWKDANDTIRIYFVLGCVWDDLHCYAWDSDKKNLTRNSWPGDGMSALMDNNNSHIKDNGKPVYYIDIANASKIEGIEFNNGYSKGHIYFAHNYGYNNNGAYVWDEYNYDNSYLATQSTNWNTDREQNYIDLTSPKGKGFKIKQYSKNSSDTIESWNAGTVGKSYVLVSNELKELVCSITDKQYFFNGLYITCLDPNNNQSLSVSYKVYTDEYGSKIYPVNKPAN